MTQEPRFYFLKPPGLPATEKDNLLGRVVKNYANPAADYAPNGSPQALISFPAPPISSGLTTVQVVLSSTSETTATGLLTSLATITRRRRDDADVSFASEGIEIVRLQQHEDTYDLLRAVPAVQQKLAKMIRVGGKAYLIVGLLIWRDSAFSTSSGSGKSTTTSLTLPVDAALAATTGGIPVPIGPVGGNFGDSKSTSSTISATASGEQIIGIEYRLIKRDLFGFGSNTKMSSANVRYEGGKFYGTTKNDKEGTDEDEDEDEDEEESGDLGLLRGVVLTNQAVEGIATEP